jgi:hypothetical protein
MKNLNKFFEKFPGKSGFYLISLAIIILYSCEHTFTSDIPLTRDRVDYLKSASVPIEQANAQFRATIQSMLQQISLENGLPELDNDFVLVNPMTSYTSPIALTEDATTSTISGLESGIDILLAYFNLPIGSEISSGFWILGVKKVDGEWLAVLRDLQGNIELNKKPVVEYKTSSENYANRTLGIYGGNYAVRFGAQLKDISFSIDIKIGLSKNIEVPQETYAQLITAEILKFRSQIESELKNILSIEGEVFIATRSDALIVASLSKSKDREYPIMYIKSEIYLPIFILSCIQNKS